MLEPKNKITFSIKEIFVGTVITIALLMSINLKNLISSFITSEKHYPELIHNQILSLLSPIRNIGFSEEKIDKQKGVIFVELTYKKPSILSEINLYFSKEFNKKINIYIKVDDQWKQVNTIQSDLPTKSVIFIEEKDRVRSTSLKIEFNNISSDTNDIYLQKIKIFKPLR